MLNKDVDQAPPLAPSKVVYDALSTGLQSTLESLGMQPFGGGGVCWERELPTGEHLFFTLQLDPDATDVFAGGGFRIEVEKSDSPRPATGLNGRALFFQLLRPSEVAQLLAQQNLVLESLPPPPAVRAEMYPAGPVRQMYLSYFKPQNGFDAIRTWLRFRSVKDVGVWVGVLAPLVAPMIDRAADVLSTGVLHLGKGPLLQAWD